MKTILVYGDSNTWGQTDASDRYAREVRWVTLLTNKLGADYEVVPAGLSGRVAGASRLVPPQKRGRAAFEVVYTQAFPTDLVIVALGTNDLKPKYALSSDQVTEDLFWYAETLAKTTDYRGQSLHPTILFIAPPNFIYSESGFNGDETKRQEIIAGLKRSRYKALILQDVDLSTDGVHFSPTGHQQMAEAVYNKLKEMGI